MASNMHVDLSECDCLWLNRKLPFRDYAQQTIIEDLTTLFSPAQTPELVYIAHRAGELLFDTRVLEQLAQCCYRRVTVIIIEPQLRSKRGRKLLEIFTERLAKNTDAEFKVRSFFTLKEAAQAIKTCTIPRGNAWVTIDPDGVFDSLPFKTRARIARQTKLFADLMQPYAYQATLSCTLQNNAPHRHLFRSVWYQEDKNTLVLLHYHRGSDALTNQTAAAWLNTKPIALLESTKNTLQYANRIIEFDKNNLCFLALHTFLAGKTTNFLGAEACKTIAKTTLFLTIINNNI